MVPVYPGRSPFVSPLQEVGGGEEQLPIPAAKKVGETHSRRLGFANPSTQLLRWKVTAS